PEELLPAFRLLFAYLGEEEQAARVNGALDLVRQGQLDPRGVFVLREAGQVTGVQVALPAAGATALVWPPQVVLGPGQPQREDQLLRGAGAWLRQQGVKLARALLAPEEVALGEPLLRNGFIHPTHLWYLRHDLSLPPDLLGTPSRLRFEPFAE